MGPVFHRRHGQGARQATELPRQRQAEPMLAQMVASEHLVTAMAAQEHTGPISRAANQQPGGNGGAIPHRLGQARQHRFQVIVNLVGPEALPLHGGITLSLTDGLRPV